MLGTILSMPLEMTKWLNQQTTDLHFMLHQSGYTTWAIMAACTLVAIQWLPNVLLQLLAGLIHNSLNIGEVCVLECKISGEDCGKKDEQRRGLLR